MNHLANEQSPYLLQHADNPVDWYPWSEEAFEKAAAEDKPVFLSIGYSTCHWCHVMEHESFEDEEVAALMNETFVSIKVDREERPDIDGVYMTACQMMTGQGGWPLSVIMTPEKRPFHVATFIPKTSRFGRLGMVDLIPRIRQIWQDRRDEVRETAGNVAASLQSSARQTSAGPLSEDVLEVAFQSLRGRFDAEHGGFGSAPKFPSAHNLLFLLRFWRRNGSQEALAMVDQTLDRMRRGGLFDQIGFGFHRYSTDRQWLLPHFEKMLYDQALLTMAYVEAYQAAGRSSFRRTAREVLTYVLRDMQSQHGVFFSAEDADSEGREGTFYVWSTGELYDVLSDDEAAYAEKTFNMLDAGNFEEEATGRRTGENVLHLSDSIEELNEPDRFERVRSLLFEHRERRPRPSLDDKILTDWNGLMIAALSKAAVAFDEDRYAVEARRAADFVLSEMRRSDGRLFHRFRGREAAVDGMLDDYAYFVWGLIELYQALFEPDYLRAARELLEIQISDFWDEEGGGFFFTAHGAEELIMRQKELHDGATPSANAVSALNLLRMARLTGETAYETRAEAVMEAAAAGVHRMPAGFTGLLSAMAFAYSPSTEIVIVAGDDPTGADELVRAARRGFAPNRVIHRSDEESGLDDIAPYTRQQTAQDGHAAAYVCRDFHCERPVTDPDELREALERQ